MKRNSDTSIIPKIIVLLGTLSVLGIILLFLRNRPSSLLRAKRPETPEKLFAQVIEAARPSILKLWEDGDRFFPKDGPNCPDEIVHDKSVGRSYYQCNPHFWQCYWQEGVKTYPSIEIGIFGQTFHIIAKPSFDPIPQFSTSHRYYKLFSRKGEDFPLSYGYIVDIMVKEIPGFSQPMILADTCRDTFLPQRIYAYGKVKDKRDEGFLWDNFDRNIFIDRFYVTNRQVNEWRVLSGQPIVSDRKKWPEPAFIPKKEQIEYCAFYGKRLLEAKLFDAAAMTPGELKNPLSRTFARPETPWQRDLSKTFLGMSRINPDYQLTPLDCQLAEVQGCPSRYFTTDSATWMGMNYALGFYPESLVNEIEPTKNLKKSSRFLAQASPWHELGSYDVWDGTQNAKTPVAFRCYEEVTP